MKVTVHRAITLCWLTSLASTAIVVTLLTLARSQAQSVPGAAASAHSSSSDAPKPVTKNAVDTDSNRPYNIKVPEESLVDLRRRLAETRWPDQETVPDQSQGVQLATIKELVRYWQTDYDWRKAEARLNALPEYVTTIDGVDIQFIWVRSKYPNAMPLIMTHGTAG